MVDIKELQDKLKENPNDYNLLEEYAIALSDIGENEEALKNFIYLKNNFPENSLVFYNIGIILEKLKYIDEAVESYEKALALKPDDVDIMYNLANLYIKSEKYDIAEELFSKVLKADNSDANSYFHLGEIYSKTNRHTQAIEALSKALELNKNDVIAKFYLAYEYNMVDDVQKAIKLYEEITEQSPDYSWAYYNLASIYISLDNEDKAIYYLERTIKTNSSDISAIKLLVKLLSKHKKYTAAENILKEAVKNMPLEADLFYLFAQLYKTVNNKSNYLKYLKLVNKNSVTFSGNLEQLKAEIEDSKGK